MVGFDGFLRWAANSWPKDPYDDASFKTIRKGNLHWRPGDTFFVYPGGELSARMIALRAGVVAAEKMRILRGQESGIRGQESGVEKKIRDIAAPYSYKAAVRGEIDFAASAADSPVSPVLPAKNTSAETGLWLGAAARAA